MNHNSSFLPRTAGFQRKWTTPIGVRRILSGLPIKKKAGLMKNIYIYLTCLTKTIVTSLLSYEELNPIFKIMLTEYSFVSLFHLFI